MNSEKGRDRLNFPSKGCLADCIETVTGFEPDGFGSTYKHGQGCPNGPQPKTPPASEAVVVLEEFIREAHHHEGCPEWDRPSFKKGESSCDPELCGLHASIAALEAVKGELAKLTAAQAENKAADKALVEWSHEVGWATGHGDTLTDIVAEMKSCQNEQAATAQAEIAKLNERHEYCQRQYCGVKQDAARHIADNHEKTAELTELRAENESLRQRVAELEKQ